MHILAIGSGSAGTMIAHCIAVAAHLSESTIVINSKELTHYEKNVRVKEIITLYPAPQLDETIFDIFKEEKIKHDEILNLSLVSLIDRKYWYHPLWNKPP